MAESRWKIKIDRAIEDKHTSINLWNNNINDQGCQYLAEALKSNNTLTYINLGNNNINYQGCQYLADALKSNNTLTEIDLEFNNISNEQYNIINELLSKEQINARKENARKLATSRRVKYAGKR